MLPDSSHATPGQLNRLREAVATRYTIDELRLLCLRLGIDMEELRPGPKSTIILALIQFLLHRDRLPDLIRALYIERPQVDWAYYYTERSPDRTRPPFPGLRPFTAGESDLYFGRRTDVARLAALLREGRFAAVLGVSGSGKSSLLQAGLVSAWRDRPVLADGTRPPEGSDAWCVLSMQPTADPLGQLALALTRDLPDARETAAIRDHLAAAPEVAALYARKLLDRQQRPHLLLIVDQFEELFTQTLDDTVRQAFIANLAYMVESPAPVSLILGLRDHFFGRCFEYPDLRRLLERPQLLLGPMGREELTQALVGPAERHGLHWETGLVDTLLGDLGASGARPPEPGALPLMAHAVREIWDRRQGDLLTLEAYSANGNVKDTIGRSADRVYDRLPSEQQAAARELFLQLVRVVDRGDSEGVYARQRAVMSDLSAADPAARATVIETLAAERLLTLSQDASGRETVEVAHEALFSHWPRLVGWLAENWQAMRRRQALGEQIDAWEQSGRHPDYLYGGEQLSEIERLLPAALSISERAFLVASQARRQSEIDRLERELVTQQQLTRRTRLFLAAVSLIAIVLAVRPIQEAYWRWQALNLSELVDVAELAIPPTSCANKDVFRVFCALSENAALESLDSFAIEIHEVSNAQFALCVRAGACTLPNDKDFNDPEWAGHPVRGITGLQATTYCRWIGRELPTAVQWEAALWGSSTERKALASNTEPVPLEEQRPDPVDTPIHTAAVGAMNLLGNISEWTRSYEPADPNGYLTDVWDGETGSLSFEQPLVVRGDSYWNSATWNNASGRNSVETFGVRCVSNQH